MNDPDSARFCRGPIWIRDGSVVLKDRLLKKTAVFINGQKIVSIGGRSCPADVLDIDASGHYVSPGFIDTHIHGKPSEIIRNEIRHGTTSMVIAESCAPLREIYERASALKYLIHRQLPGPSVLGFRLEGPYISKEKSGAQDRRYIRQPDVKELSEIIARCSPALKIMTIAPELKSAISAIRMLSQKGIIASAGHSYASYRETKDGIAAGVRHVTHIFNAMRGVDGNDRGIVGAVLSDKRVFAEVILDLVHVRPELFRALIQAKGIDRVILITDSVRALGQKGVKKHAGAYRFPDGHLAGSSLTMIGAVKNAVRSCGLSIQDAVRLATINPAKLLGIQGSKGSVEAGKDADIVIFDKDFNVKMAIARGKILYCKRGF